MDNKISVIMACYNCEKTLPSAIESILKQTYTNWVMICCDDGSSDSTLAILKEYKEKYPDKFVILENGENRKLPFSLNRCLEAVSTSLVARMDADDVSAPERLEIQAKYLADHPECDLVGTGIAVLNGKGTITPMLQPQYPEAKDMLRCSCFSHATIMTYKRVYDELGGYSLESRAERCEDIDLWSRFLQKGFVGHNVPDLLYTVVEDDEAVKRRSLKSRIKLAKTLRVICKRLDLHGVAALKRIYGQLILAFIPTPVYKWLHLKKIARSSKKVENE
jgi:glycosyltransferase EpsE